jgi:uncharacterized membrane protein (UPF0127 family)
MELPDSTIAAESSPIGTSEPTTTVIASTVSPPEIPDDLAAFGISTVTVGGETWLVAVADTPDERSDGLRAVEDLGDVDGMLFVYDEEVTNSFTMRDVTLPLEIGFFDGGGSLIDTQQMVPCLTDQCPSYVAAGPFRWAIETFPGGIFGRPLGTELFVD